MKKILITGATGNIGFEVIQFLNKLNTNNKIIVGVRNIKSAKNKLSKFSNLKYVHFDFEQPKTFNNALNEIDGIFLVRPPQIANIEKYFKPLIKAIKDANIKKIVFISVQGVEKSKVIPHHKIEALIKENDLEYIFLRPSYFMQNLTTTLYSDIKNKREIILPAGKAIFNWVDVENIGEISAIVLTKFNEFKNQAFEITGDENKKFYEVTELINTVITNPIKYRNVNLFNFFYIKKREGMETAKIIVIIVLHFLPRFQKQPKISNFYEKLTGKKPTSLKEFIEREKKVLDTDSN